jgi:hypothetical protein
MSKCFQSFVFNIFLKKNLNFPQYILRKFQSKINLVGNCRNFINKLNFLDFDGELSHRLILVFQNYYFNIF